MCPAGSATCFVVSWLILNMPSPYGDGWTVTRVVLLETLSAHQAAHAGHKRERKAGPELRDGPRRLSQTGCGREYKTVAPPLQSPWAVASCQKFRMAPFVHSRGAFLLSSATWMNMGLLRGHARSTKLRALKAVTGVLAHTHGVDVSRR